MKITFIEVCIVIMIVCTIAVFLLPQKPTIFSSYDANANKISCSESHDLLSWEHWTETGSVCHALASERK
jgi:hypothetical protein